MQKLPERLFSSQEKVTLIKQVITNDCILLRRTELDDYLTPYDEIDVEIIRDIDLFRMSTNVYLCRRKEVDLENRIKDANIIFRKIEHTKFINDEQIPTGDLEEFDFDQKETLIIGFKIKDLENIKGPYILGKGTKKSKELNYKIEVEYDPLVLNCFHMESIISCNETEEEIKRSKKGYRQAIASDIKVQLMNKKNVIIYNYHEIDDED